MINLKNEMKLTDKDVAKLIAEDMYYHTSTSKTSFAFQLFIEALVLPKDCNSYSNVELEKYILHFMENQNVQIH